MAQVVFNANKQSTLLNSAKQGGVQIEEFQYDLPRPYPMVFKDYHVKHIVNNLDFAGSSSVELSSFGTLRELYIKWNVTWTNGTAQAGKVVVSKNLFATIVKRVALMNSSREIYQVFSDEILWKTRGIEDKGERAKWLMAGDANLELLPTTLQVAGSRADAGPKINTGNNGVNSLEFYTKIPFSFLSGKFQSNEPRKTALNLRFSETMRLLIETNPDYYVAAGAGEANEVLLNLKIASCEVFAHYDIVEPSDLQKIESQYSMSEPLSQLNGNAVMTESSITSSAGEPGKSTTHKVKVYNTNLLQNLVVVVNRQRTEDNAKALATVVATGASNGTDQMIAVNGYGAAAGTAANVAAIIQTLNPHFKTKHSAVAAGNSRIGDDYCKITSLTVKSSGRIIFEATSYKQLLMATSDFTNWVDTDGSHQETNAMLDKNSCSDANIFMIPMSEMPHANALTGNLALKGLSTIDVEVTFVSVASQPYDVKVYTNFQGITSTETTSGRIISSVSS